MNIFHNPSITFSAPVGGATLDAVIARSDGAIAARFRALGDDAAAKAAAAEGAYAAHEHSRTAHTEARRVQANLASAYEAFEIAEGSPQAADVARAAENERRATLILTGQTGPALKQANEASAAAQEVMAKVTRHIAGKKADNSLVAQEVEIGHVGDFGNVIATKGETLAAARLRRGAVKTALPPADSVKRTMRNRVADAAARGEPEVTGLFGGTKRLGFTLPTALMKNVEPNRFSPGDQPRIIDIEAVLCRYFGDQIIADLEAQIDAEYSGELGDEVLSASEKQSALAKLDAKIDLLEREMAELIWMAREAGHDIPFPSDLPAAAILGVEA